MSANSESCPLCGWPAEMEYDPSKNVEQQPRPQVEQPQVPQQGNYPKKVDPVCIAMFCCAVLAALVVLFFPWLLGKKFLLVISFLLALVGLVGSILFFSKPGKAKASAQDIMNVLLGSGITLSALSVIRLIISLIRLIR